MKVVPAAAISAILACSLPITAQEPRTGVSTPPAPIDSAASASPDQATIPGYQPTPSPALLHRDSAPTNSFADTATVPTDQPEPAHASTRKDDIDAGIVISVPHTEGELPVGTTFRARMRETLSTASTQSGTPFFAQLIDPVEQNGRIVIPSGTVVEGRVTQVRGGHRIHGAAALHLDPRKLIFPDGSQHLIHAQVIDTDQSFATRIDSEGTILRRDHIKTTLAVLGASTGTAAVAGAIVGGGVGAVVGAGIGAGLSTAWWLKQDRQTVLPEETAVIFSLNEPVSMTSPLR